MLKLYVWMTDIVRSERAQDMVEYALLTGLLAVVAGAALPGIRKSLVLVGRRVSSVLVAAGGVASC